MNSAKYCKLVMVAVGAGSAAQSNKYYEMKWDGISSNFNVTYGRVESTAQTASCSIHDWDKKRNEKLKKGYKDMTHTVAVVEDTTPAAAEETKLGKIQDAKVERFIALMQQYSKNLVQKTYKVRHQDVTQQQVDNAQNFINKLRKTDKKDVSSINALLVELYMEIPRYMGDVRDYLMPRINLDKTLEQEQDNLDAMAAQVQMYQTSLQVNKKQATKQKKETKTLLDLLGIKMKEVMPTKEVQHLVSQIGGGKIQGLFEVDKNAENQRFGAWMATQKNKETKLVFHGTKCISVVPILEQGLKIRPSGNFQFSGKVYGDGNYFSEEFNTSLGYTDYGTGDRVMFIYEVHVGKAYTYGTSPTVALNYRSLQQAGYDCTYLKGSNGRQQMVISYNEPQCKVKYVLWLK